MLIQTSINWSLSPRYFSKMAIISVSLAFSIPCATLSGYFHAILLSNTSSWMSTALPLSIQTVSTDPFVCLLCSITLSLRLQTGCNHHVFISKIHTSLVDQNLFFLNLRNLKFQYCSHSKQRTTSTICSRYFGHAISHHLVICQIMINVVCSCLHARLSISQHNLTCHGDHGVLSERLLAIVCIESIITILQFSSLIVSAISSQSLL